MRLRQIEVFYHVYKAGSISGAARDLSVSQPSVSKVLRHAEDQLGVELFLRSKGRLIPTEAAHELYAEAADIYARLSTFNRSLENIGKRRGGHIRLGVLPALSLSLGPELVSRLRAEDRMLSFELTTLHSTDIPRSLLEKDIDFCLCFDVPEDDRIIATQIGEGRMVLVSGNALGVDPGAVDASIVDDAEFVGMRDSGPLGQMISEALESRNIEPNEIVSAHTYHVALSLVRKKIGIAITDQFTAYSHLGAGLHRHILDDLPKFPIQAVALDDHPNGQLIERAITHSRAAVSALNAGIASMQLPRP
ncbi:MAG: LysR family transcriptional regulator [Sphingomonadales bacterium]|nr:MAG: LysR family transcriptional regulator [Sphingomonadales bacterium]